jgi:Leucine-rich repeat (LRR) protein
LKLDSLILSCNKITEVNNIGYSPNLTILDLKNNKLQVLSKEISFLKNLKTLDLTNNDLTDLPTEIAFLDKLVRLHLEGNSLKVIKHSVRSAGAEVITLFILLNYLRR